MCCNGFSVGRKFDLHLPRIISKMLRVVHLRAHSGRATAKKIFKTRMHSSRMRTTHSLTIGGGGGGVCPGGGVPCDLSHNAFDAICMLS